MVASPLLHEPSPNLSCRCLGAAMQNKPPAQALAGLAALGALAGALALSTAHADPAAAEDACASATVSSQTETRRTTTDDPGSGTGTACTTARVSQPPDSTNAHRPARGSHRPQPEPETLIVRAARLPLPAAKLGSSVTLLDGDLLARRQGALLGELLRGVPGVAVSRAGGVGALTQLRMRGGESNHVLVFIDGVRANDPAQNSEFNFANLLASGIESVEIIRGPQSSLWGSDALSGVISVTTRRADAGTDAAAFMEGGSDAWRRFGGSASYGGERLRMRLGASELNTAGDNISRSGDEQDGHRNTTLSLAFDYAFAPSLRTAASFRYTDANNEFDGVDFGTGLPADRDNETDARQIYGQLGATLDALDGRWQHRLGYALTDTGNNNRTENAFAPTGYDLNTTDARADVFSYQTSFAIAEGQVVTGAYERQEQRFSQRGPVGFGDPNRDEKMSADSFTIEYSGGISPAFALLASARNDRNSDFQNNTTGRLSAAWRVAPAIKLRAAYGTGSKHPTFTERYGYFTSFIGNPNLKPEHSRGWELGADTGRPGGPFTLGLTWFDEALRDEINGFVFDPATGAFTARNEDGKSRRRGLELQGHWLPATGLRLGFAYTWLDAEEDNAGTGRALREIRRPEHTASANLDWGFLDGRANLNLNLDYNGAQDDFYYPPVPPYRERVQLNAFTLLSVAGSYRLARGLTLFARAENALGEDYEAMFGFSAPGRAAYAGLRYQFGN